MSTLRLKRRRDVARQKWQFIAVVVTVILGVMLFAGTYNAYLNLGTSLEGSYERLAMADMVVRGAEDGFVDTANATAGVEVAIERRQIDPPMEVGDKSLVGRVLGMPMDEQPAVNMIDIDEGSYLFSGDPMGVVVETHMASDFDLMVGSTFDIAGVTVTVRGIATSPEYLWPAKDKQNIFTPPGTFGVVFADEALLEDLTGPVVQDQVLVLYTDDADRATVDSSITSSANAADADDVEPLEEQPSNETINLEISGLQTMAIAFPLLFLTAAGMAIYVVITRLVYSQRGVIGTLRASGFSSRTLARHYRSYGVGVGLIGAAIGSVFGGLLARGMTAIYVKVFNIPDLVAAVHIPTVLLALLFGAVAGAIASVPPARAVARMAPAEAMRGNTPASGGKRSIFETLVPPLRGAPVRWRMTLRGIGRNKPRSLALVLGVVLALVLIMASWGMMDTMLLAMDRQFNEVAIEDASTVFSVPVGDAEVDSITAVNGVAVSEPVIGLSAVLSRGPNSYTTLLEGYQPNTQVHGFPNGLPSTGTLVGQSLEGLLGVSVGDPITIEFPDIETTVQTSIAGFVDELGTLAYMEATALKELIETASPQVTAEVLSAPTFTSVKSVFDDTAVNEAVIERIGAVDNVAAVIDASQMRDLINEFQVFFYVFIGMMIIFGGAMAFALIFNIVSVNVAERSSEFASMRANGLTYRKVANMINGEVFLLVGIGLIPGLIAGYLAAVAFVNSFASDQFPITAELRPATYIGATVAMFVVAGLSLIPALRAVKRINVGEIVRERSV
ncbi:MAG: ABC transporter permease [Acidimicrobiia bacterium]